MEGPLNTQNTPPIARETMAEVARRLEAGEDPRAILADYGVPEGEIERRMEALSALNRGPERERAVALSHFMIGANYLTWLQRWLRSGDPAADWGIVFLPDFSEAERLAALRRILGRMKGRAIHRARWNANLDAFAAACKDLGVTAKEREGQSGWEAVHDALEGLTPHETRTASDRVMKRFRSRLQRLICDDLLIGHDWGRSRRRGVSIEDAPPEALKDEHHEERQNAIRAKAEIERLMARADLTEYQDAVLALDMQGYTAAEIAEALDRPSADAVGSAKYDAIQKLREVGAEPEP